MAKHDNPAERGPETKTDESAGKIKQEQLTDRMMPEKDLARGSEPETRGTSRGR